MALNRVWIPSPNYSSRSGTVVKQAIVHTAEGALTYQSLGVYFQGNVGASSHVGIDDTPATIGEYVRRPDKAWTQASANPWCVSVELCAFAAWSSAEWDRHPNMLANCAAWIAEECAHYDIPITRLSASQAQAGTPGVAGHNELGQMGGGHWDPGPNFPWDRVLTMARGGMPIPPTEDEMAIAAAVNADGRMEVFVHKDDGTVVHAYQKAAGAGWAGSEEGKPAAWYPLGKPGK